MKIYLLNSSKRVNSFAVIPLANITANECYIKNDTNILRPTFALKFSIEILEYNYLYCDDFKRYYFIRNINCVKNDFWEIECEIDVLATYKVEILQNVCFIERAETGFNTKIIDNLVTKLSDFTTISNKVTLDFFDDVGSYFITSASDATMSTIWNINETELNTLAEELMSDTGFIDEMQKYYNQPMNAIYEMHWLPLQKGAFGGADLPVSFANWSSDIIVGKRISNTTITKEFGIRIPKPYTDFRLENSCVYMLYLPCCVPIEIENSFIEPSDLLYIKYTIDCADGNIIARIYTLENGFIAKTSGNIKTNRPIASIVQNTPSQTFGAISGLGAMITPNPIIFASGIMSTVQSVAIRPQVSATGNYGGKGAYVSDNNTAILNCTYNKTVDPNDINKTCGRPVMIENRLLNYTGFLKCDNASVSINATSEEKELANSLLNGGVYIE